MKQSRLSLRSLYRLQGPEGEVLKGVKRIQTAIVAYTAPLLGVAGLGVVWLLVEQDVHALRYGIATGTIVSVFLLLAPLFAVVTRNIPMIGMFLVVSVWISLSVGAFESNGIQSGQIPLLAQLPIWATFFMGRRGAILTLAMVLLSLTVMLVIGPTAILNGGHSEPRLVLADALMAITAASIVLVVVYIQEYLLADLDRQKIEIEKSSVAKSEFLSSMSHELRTPMNAILGFAQLLEFDPKEPLSGRQKTSVDSILKGGSHLLELIDKVLELNKIEAGKLSLSFDHVSARVIIDECLDLVSPRAEKEGVEIFDRTTGHDLPLLWTDSTRLTQVLLNLLSNAVKYNRMGGTVTVKSEEMPGPMLRISVIDTGNGIPAAKQGDLFKPFERLGREAGTVEGTGIGLTITRQIIDLLGGQVEYESIEGEGSTFWIDVPISGKHGEYQKESTAGTSVNLGAKRKKADGPGRTILYIEDNADNTLLMEAVIGRFADARLLSAPSAELGIALAVKERPDLILLDINLPGMNGFEALKQLQDTMETKDIVVIAITAAAMPAEVEAGMQAGFRDYVTKPLDIPKFVQIIRKHLESLKSSA